jgi:hypothetical protein
MEFNMDFYDLFQNYRMHQIDIKASKSKEDIENSKLKIFSIQDQVNYLSVVCLALSEILTEQGVSKDKIINKIHEIDIRDGYHDNKIKSEIHLCPNCKRKVSLKRTKCLYCGTEIYNELI